ncbi:hypothetical protein BN946_scf184939.g17 [Trametes cinnabarina]|uniref:Uncharacterized protein n=1 Tax=Pycnoporus cinnabarinus TaxID=5643 RepID=A0A060SHC7_PYCCI|nr:hypothetical protein BN946_scf184939.g17 [Trametes cinnabarina]
MKASLVVMHKHPFIDLFRYVKRLDIELDANRTTIANLTANVFADACIVSELRSSNAGDFNVNFFEIPESVQEEYSRRIAFSEMLGMKGPIDLIREVIEPRTCGVEDPALKKEIEGYESRINWPFLEQKCNALREGSALQNIKDPRNLIVVLYLPRSKPVEPGSIWAQVNEYREAIAAAAQRRIHPTLEATNERLCRTQQPNRVDAIYNGRGESMRPPNIFHTSFSTFQRMMENPEETAPSAKVSSKELNAARRFTQNCMRTYEKRTDRIAAMQDMADAIHQDLFTPSTLNSPGGQFAPDGVVYGGLPTVDGRRPIMCITEVLTDWNATDGDPIEKAQQAYLAYYCSKEGSIFRQVSSCPCLLLCIIGGQLMVLGALFADRVVAYHLDNVISMERRVLWDPSVDIVGRIARFFRAFRATLQDLDAYYAGIAEEYRDKALAQLPLPQSITMSPHSTAQSAVKPQSYVGPHFRTFKTNGQQVHLTYTGRIRTVPKAAAYNALATISGGDDAQGDAREVVVLFLVHCATEVHRLLANPTIVPDAPRLWFMEWVESADSIVVVMDRVDQGAMALAEFLALEQKARAQQEDERRRDVLVGESWGPYILRRRSKEQLLLIDFDNTEEARTLRLPQRPEPKAPLARTHHA